jgi:hypothetical protein
LILPYRKPLFNPIGAFIFNEFVLSSALHLGVLLAKGAKIVLPSG